MELKRFAALALAAMLALPLCAQMVSAQDKVRTFNMPYYPGFPVWLAHEMGLFEKHGIDTEPKYFPSGAPIIQAAAAKQWDISFLGAPPVTLAGPKLGLQTISVVQEGAAIHRLIGRPDLVSMAKDDPASIKGKKIFVTTLSTGHYMVEGCLAKMGLTQEDVTILPSEQTATASAFAAGEGDLAQVWPPQDAALLRKGNEVLCDGAQAGVSIPDVWVAAPHFVEENPDVIVRWLKATSEAIDWIKEDRERTYEMYLKFEEFRGFDLDDDVLQAEVDVVMGLINTGDQQLAAMAVGDDGKSSIAKSYEGVAGFFKRVGRMDSIPDYQPLINTTFLEKALAD